MQGPTCSFWLSDLKKIRTALDQPDIPRVKQILDKGRIRKYDVTFVDGDTMKDLFDELDALLDMCSGAPETIVKHIRSTHKVIKDHLDKGLNNVKRREAQENPA